MHKLTFSKGKAMVCLILICLLLAQSCKKDLLLPKKTENNSTDKIRSISYSQFVNAINLNSTGSLKSVLSGQKSKVMSTQALPGNLDLEMDSVKKLTLGDTISYVIAIKPQTSRATAFQNLTIQVIENKTTAFLSTYYPEKEWLDNWREKLKTKFKGTIVFNKIYLDDISLNDRLNTAELASHNGGLKDKLLATVSGNSGNRNIISLAPGECEFYDVFTVVAYPCSTGDMPGHCAWENDGGLTMGMLDYLPGYRVDKNTVINCAMPNFPSGGGGGGGGGGSTTPYTPGTYNPCDGTPQPVGPGGISFERGTRLMVAAQTDCDETSGPPVITTTQTPQQYLMNHLDLDVAEQNFVNNPLNGLAVTELTKYLINNGLSIDNTNFIHWSVGYLKEYQNIYPSFKNVFLNGSSDLVSENIQIENDGTNFLSANDYSISGISNFFTEAEFDNLIQNLSNNITEDPIQLYMIACYKSSKLLNSSMYSKPNNFQIGEYTLCPHYNSQNKLVFYSAFRKSGLGIEYLIRADALNTFKINYTLYKSAANLFYVNGKPSYSQIQMSAGDYWEGVVESYKEAFSNPMYYLYLGHVFVATATNLNSVPTNNPVKITVNPENDPIKWTSTSIRNTVKVSVTIENRTIAQYRDMISQKYNAAWQDIGNGKFKLEVGQNRYISNPAASSTEKPTIYYFRNGKDIGRFRFNN
ncbi:hypothetical protein [Pedobacter suwonensis]|uniref:hypothetical protein n=1 Tax=Pedobacter suwonensis TaxID=332999 RepID=UPI0011A32C26|nr:hypothetical protein [Pedobacter suwonensis]